MSSATAATVLTNPAATGCIIDPSRCVELTEAHAIASANGVEYVLVPGAGDPAHVAGVAVQMLADCGFDLGGLDAVVRSPQRVTLCACDNPHHEFHPAFGSQAGDNARWVSVVTFDQHR